MKEKSKTAQKDFLATFDYPRPFFPLESNAEGRVWRWLNGPEVTLLVPRDPELYSYARLGWVGIMGSGVQIRVDEILQSEVQFPQSRESWLDLGRGKEPASVHISVLDWTGQELGVAEQRGISAALQYFQVVSLARPAPLPKGEILCPALWSHLFVTEDGRFAPCCDSADAPQSKLRDESGKELRFVNQESMKEAWNSSSMRAMRRDSFEGNWPAACEKCRIFESHGIGSYRGMLMGKIPIDPLRVLESAQADFSAPEEWPFVDLRLGNVCNLRCRMCTPGFSVALLEEFDALAPEVSAAVRAQKDSYQWYQSEKVWDALTPHLPYMKEIQLAGGEPFRGNALLSVLNELNRRGAVNHILLNFTTNLSDFPIWTYEAFPKFKAVKMRVSVDGVGKLQEYIRFPSSFDHLIANLRLLDRDFSALNLEEIITHVTVQALNIWQLPEIIRLINISFTNITAYPHLSLVHDRQSQFSIACLPEKFKRRIAERLEFGQKTRSFVPRGGIPGCADFLFRLDGIVRYMLENHRQERLPEMRSSLCVVDEKRRQDFRMVAPELAAAIF